jgi:hypothetical protein
MLAAVILQVDRLLVLEVIEGDYPALCHLAQRKSRAFGLFQAGANSCYVKVALAAGGIDPGAKPAIRLS